MTISDIGVVDIVTTNNANAECVLTISDHLPWDEPGHLLMLQEKLNTYLSFIESGEIEGPVPDAKYRSIRINVVLAHEPTKEALDFLAQAQSIIRGAGFELAWELVPDM